MANNPVEAVVDSLVKKAAFYISAAVVFMTEPGGDVDKARFEVIRKITDEVKAELHSRGETTYERRPLMTTNKIQRYLISQLRKEVRRKSYAEQIRIILCDKALSLITPAPKKVGDGNG